MCAVRSPQAHARAGSSWCADTINSASGSTSKTCATPRKVAGWSLCVRNASPGRRQSHGSSAFLAMFVSKPRLPLDNELADAERRQHLVQDHPVKGLDRGPAQFAREHFPDRGYVAGTPGQGEPTGIHAQVQRQDLLHDAAVQVDHRAEDIEGQDLDADQARLMQGVGHATKLTAWGLTAQRMERRPSIAGPTLLTASSRASWSADSSAASAPRLSASCCAERGPRIGMAPCVPTHASATSPAQMASSPATAITVSSTRVRCGEFSAWSTRPAKPSARPS